MRALQWDYEVRFILGSIVDHARHGPCERNTVMLLAETHQYLVMLIPRRDKSSSGHTLTLDILVADRSAAFVWRSLARG